MFVLLFQLAHAKYPPRRLMTKISIAHDVKFRSLGQSPTNVRTLNSVSSISPLTLIYNPGIINWLIKHFFRIDIHISTLVKIGKTRNCVKTRRPAGVVFSHNFSFFQF